jgi:4-alpha-glucanotransferase
MDPHLGRGGRAAGIAVSLYGVRSLRDWGCGDFGFVLSAFICVHRRLIPFSLVAALLLYATGIRAW